LPDYNEDDPPEFPYFYGILGTLCEKETEDMIRCAFKLRSNKGILDNGDCIELTQEMYDMIQDVIVCKSILIYPKTNLATSGRGIDMMKIKAKGKKELKPRLTFPASLEAFRNPPRRKVHRFSGLSSHDVPQATETTRSKYATSQQSGRK